MRIHADFSRLHLSRNERIISTTRIHISFRVWVLGRCFLIYVPFQRAGANEKVLCWQKVHLETILSTAPGKIILDFFLPSSHSERIDLAYEKTFFSMVNRILNFQDATFLLPPPSSPPPKMMNFRKANNDKWLSIKRWQGKLFLLYIVQQTMPYPSQLSIETNLNFPLTLLLTSYIRVFHVPLRAKRREKCV